MLHEHRNIPIVSTLHCLMLSFQPDKFEMPNDWQRIAKANSKIFEIITVSIFIGSVLCAASMSRSINHLPHLEKNGIECASY